MPSLNVSHREQRQQADCLAACAAMVLDYLGVSIRYRRLMRRLQVRAFGTLFSNLERLQSLGVKVEIAEGSFPTLHHYLEQDLPVIAAVNTWALTYWDDEVTSYAIVVTRIENDKVLVHDPAFPDAPKRITAIEFEAAWIEKDYLYAVLTA